jgi:glutamyl-tRNA synthetase
MSDEEFAERAKGFVENVPDYLEKNWGKLCSLLRTRVARFGEIGEQIAFLIEQPAFDASLYVNKRNKVTVEKAQELLPDMIALLETVDEAGWNNDNLYAKLEAYIAEKELKKGLAMWVLRIAVAGQSVTPGGATELLEMLGREISLERLKKSLANLTAL